MKVKIKFQMQHENIVQKEEVDQMYEILALEGILMQSLMFLTENIVKVENLPLITQSMISFIEVYKS